MRRAGWPTRPSKSHQSRQRSHRDRVRSRFASRKCAPPSRMAPTSSTWLYTADCSCPAVSDGADEIDMVINRGLFLSGELNAVQDEISAVVEACGDAQLKVILEVT